MEEDEVEEFIPQSCLLTSKIRIKFPINFQTSGTSFGKMVSSISLSNFRRSQFEYDATWITKRFHSLNKIWDNQSSVVQNKIRTIISEAFEEALRKIEPSNWVTIKLNKLKEQIEWVKVGESNNSSTPSITERNYNIDNGLLSK